MQEKGLDWIKMPYKIKREPKPRMTYAYIEGDQLAVDVKVGKRKFGGFIPEIKKEK